jgi:predicted phage terminase large subunit-like protein
MANSSEEWEILNFPAISPNRQALWPSRYNLGALEKIRREIGSRKFDALYQGEPSSEDGNIIKREWFQYYSALPQTSSSSVWIQSWDLAFKGNDASDYVVGQLWLKQNADYYLVDQVRGRFDFVQTVEQIKGFTSKYPQAKLKIIEDAANGAAVHSQLKRVIEGIVLQKPEGSKVSRVNSITPLFEAKNIHLPIHTPWIEDYTEEFASFPYGKNDDQVDATTQALAKLSNMASAQFIASSNKNVSARMDVLTPFRGI